MTDETLKLPTPHCALCVAGNPEIQNDSVKAVNEYLESTISQAKRFTEEARNDMLLLDKLLTDYDSKE